EAGEDELGEDVVAHGVGVDGDLVVRIDAAFAEVEDAVFLDALSLAVDTDDHGHHRRLDRALFLIDRGECLLRLRRAVAEGGRGKDMRMLEAAEDLRPRAGREGRVVLGTLRTALL